MNSSSPTAQKRCDPAEQRVCLADVQRIVVKVGSSTISNGTHLNEAALDGLVHDLALVKQDGVEVILVTSGAIAARLAPTRPEAASEYATTPTSCCCRRADTVDGSLQGPVLKLWTTRREHAPSHATISQTGSATLA